MTALLPSEVLARAADLIEPEGTWTQRGDFAYTADGRGRWGSDPDAVCFCAAGATQRVTVDRPVAANPLAYLERVIGNSNIAEWNDAPNRTQAEVVAALRAASELAKGEGQ